MRKTLRALWLFSQAEEIKKTINSFKRHERIIFLILVLLMIVSSFQLVSAAHKVVTREVPIVRGSVTEGVIGQPRLINPVLASTQIDKDLAELTFAGLLKRGKEGELLPDLAEEYEVSDDNFDYTFIMKEGATFHDGTRITADDVIFTLTMIQDPLVRSPLKVNFEGVGVEKIDSRTIVFRLNQPYAGFLENMTVGIIPEHIWSNISYEHIYFAEVNTEPVGSGPFKFEKSWLSGERKRMVLSRFADFVSGAPYLQEYEFYFYDSEDSLLNDYRNGLLDLVGMPSIAAVDSYESEEHKKYTAPLSRVFGLFFNDQTQPLLQEKRLREIIASIINNEQIVEYLFKDYAIATDTPWPYGYIEGKDIKFDKRLDRDTIVESLDLLGYIINEETGRREKVDKNGARTPLSFNIVTSNSPELINVAAAVVGAMDEYGIAAEVIAEPQTDLVQDVIPKREFDILLFGQSFSHDTNLFAYWHSSQRNDPGLNVASYASSKANRILEASLTEADKGSRYDLYADLAKTLEEDRPAVMLYTPLLIYLADEKIKDVEIPPQAMAEDRYATVAEWYIHTARILKWFKDKK